MLEKRRLEEKRRHEEYLAQQALLKKQQEERRKQLKLQAQQTLFNLFDRGIHSERRKAIECLRRAAVEKESRNLQQCIVQAQMRVIQN